MKRNARFFQIFFKANLSDSITKCGIKNPKIPEFNIYMKILRIKQNHKIYVFKF